ELLGENFLQSRQHHYTDPTLQGGRRNVAARYVLTWDSACGTRKEAPMKIRVERDALADAVAWVARSLPARPSVPVLGGVLLDAADGEALTISAFDYEVSATVRVTSTIADGGRPLVSGRLLADITKASPAQPVEISVDGSRSSIICGSARFSLPTMPVEDYPQLPHQPALAGEVARSEEHTSELQSRFDLVCRLLLEKHNHQ